MGLVVVACSSSDDAPAATKVSCALTSECAKDQACGFVNGDQQECVPIACAVLADCNGHLSLLTVESNAPEPTTSDVTRNYEVVRARDARTCADRTKAIQAGGHCIPAVVDGSPLTCDATGASCSLSFNLSFRQGTCCEGSVCVLTNGVKSPTQCRACGGAGTCSYNDNPCCNGMYCDVLDGKCHAAKDDGEACGGADECKSNTCTDGKCTKYTPPPSHPAPVAEGSGIGDSTCESSWCHGCTGTCCSYCAGSCQSRCSGLPDF